MINSKNIGYKCDAKLCLSPTLNPHAEDKLPRKSDIRQRIKNPLRVTQSPTYELISIGPHQLEGLF